MGISGSDWGRRYRFHIFLAYIYIYIRPKYVSVIGHQIGTQPTKMQIQHGFIIRFSIVKHAFICWFLGETWWPVAENDWTCVFCRNHRMDNYNYIHNIYIYIYGAFSFRVSKIAMAIWRQTWGNKKQRPRIIRRCSTSGDLSSNCALEVSWHGGNPKSFIAIGFPQ